MAENKGMDKRLFQVSKIRKLFRVINMSLVKWVCNKYRKFRRRHWYNAYKYLKGIVNNYPNMLVHWHNIVLCPEFVFVMKNRMNRNKEKLMIRGNNREVQTRF